MGTGYLFGMKPPVFPVCNMKGDLIVLIIVFAYIKIKSVFGNKVERLAFPSRCSFFPPIPAGGGPSFSTPLPGLRTCFFLIRNISPCRDKNSLRTAHLLPFSGAPPQIRRGNHLSANLHEICFIFCQIQGGLNGFQMLHLLFCFLCQNGKFLCRPLHLVIFFV